MSFFEEMWELFKLWGVPVWTLIVSVLGLLVGVLKWICDERKQHEQGKLQINCYSSEEFDIVIRNTGKIIFHVEAVFLTISTDPDRALRLSFPPYQGQKLVWRSSTDHLSLVPVEMFTLEPGRSRISGVSHQYLIEKLSIVPGRKVDLIATAYLESGKHFHATLRNIELEAKQKPQQNK